jgi:hypothetical protein
MSALRWSSALSAARTSRFAELPTVPYAPLSKRSVSAGLRFAITTSVRVLRPRRIPEGAPGPSTRRRPVRGPGGQRRGCGVRPCYETSVHRKKCRRFVSAPRRLQRPFRHQRIKLAGPAQTPAELNVVALPARFAASGLSGLETRVGTDDPSDSVQEPDEHPGTWVTAIRTLQAGANCAGTFDSSVLKPRSVPN